MFTNKCEECSVYLMRSLPVLKRSGTDMNKSSPITSQEYLKNGLSYPSYPDALLSSIAHRAAFTSALLKGEIKEGCCVSLSLPSSNQFRVHHPAICTISS